MATTSGMTLKQYWRTRFFDLLELYRQLAHDTTPEGKQAFIVTSIQLHIASGRVPKSYRKYINQAVKHG